MPQTRTNEDVSFVVPEPCKGHASECSWMNNLERQKFGGSPAIKLELRNGGKYKAEGQKNLPKAFDSALDLVDH